MRATFAPMSIQVFEGDRASLLPLFRLADDSEQAIAHYLAKGVVFVAIAADRCVGHVQVVEAVVEGERELKSLAVESGFRGQGLGRKLVAFAAAHAAAGEARVLRVATALADIGNLRFYQRLGFRAHSIERDAFTAETGYASGIAIDGILLRDRIWFELMLSDALFADGLLR